MPFRYLGIPMAAERLRIADYSPLLDSLVRRINIWPQKTLSYAGKAQLITSVLQGVECFWLSIMPLPQGVIDRIYSICRSFMWTSKHPPVSWADMCRPKQESGLGFRDLKAWNLALLAKVLWRIQAKEDALWIKWVHHTYLRRADIWTWEAAHSDSPLIKRLLRIRDLILSAAGSQEDARQRLAAWFAQDGGVARAYDFFRHPSPKKPWARAVWKTYLQ